MLDKLLKFFNHWYLRYLLTTELMLVEAWERHLAHFILLILFLITAYINVNVVAYGTTAFYSWIFPLEAAAPISQIQ